MSGKSTSFRIRAGMTKVLVCLYTATISVERTRDLRQPKDEESLQVRVAGIAEPVHRPGWRHPLLLITTIHGIFSKATLSMNQLLFNDESVVDRNCKETERLAYARKSIIFFTHPLVLFSEQRLTVNKLVPLTRT